MLLCFVIAFNEAVTEKLNDKKQNFLSILQQSDGTEHIIPSA